MWYWNKANFEGLEQIAESLNTQPGFADFAAYCRLRVKGLRKQAFAALERFLMTFRSWDFERRCQVVDWLMQAHIASPDVHYLFSTPLQQQAILPTLHEWMQTIPHDAIPYRWYGLLTNQRSFLEQALERDPHDQFARKAVVNNLLGHVEYATHHLDESYLLGTVQDVQNDLQQALHHAQKLTDGTLQARCMAEIQEFQSLLDDWVEYSRTSVGTFRAWCEQHGRTYSWWQTYNYQEQGTDTP